MLMYKILFQISRWQIRRIEKLTHSSKQVVNQKLEHNCQSIETETVAPI